MQNSNKKCENFSTV